jgi:hypothetical protein
VRLKSTCSSVLVLCLVGAGWPVRVHAGPGPIEAAIAREAARLAAIQPKDQNAEAGWASVTALPAGTPILLITRGGEPVRRTLVNADDSGIVVSNDGSAENVSRLDVVEVKLPGERLGSWLAGAIAAGLSFTLIGLPLAIGFAEEPCEPNCGSEKAGVAISAVGIPVGAGYLGYKIFGRSRPDRTIYRAPSS